MTAEKIKKLQHLLADAYSLLSISQQILSGTIVEPRDLGYIRKNIRDAMAIINDVSMPYEDNLFIVTDEARAIVAEKHLRAEGFRVGIPVKKFSWKYIGWGLGAIKVQLMSLELAADERDALRCYNILKKISETSQTILDMLEQLPEIKLLKKATKL